VYYNSTVALEFFRRAAGEPRTLGVLPAGFNPPTRAHLALAEAALGVVDEVLFVLPREFPHKSYEDTTFTERMEMLLAATGGEPRYSVASSEGGLFLEIAAECREAHGENTALAFICGRDAAERIINWDYGRPDAVQHMLQEFEMLVAPRAGDFQPPGELQARIQPLAVDGGISAISATEVRERVRQGRPWEAMVPAEIVSMVRKIYGG
jgi:nicotinate (nicotinamide) nucleotide adenylyltransferase